MLIFETFYHIYNHANGDDILFKEEKNYDYFLDKYHQHIDPIATTVAWCLMPNHFHFLVKIKSEEEIASAFPKFETLEKLEAKSKFISKQFANFFSSYTQSFNKVYDRRGSLFLKNFKRKEISDDNYMQNLILYIHLNPIKHGFSRTINEWVHTSYDQFPQKHPLLLRELFEDDSNYQYAHRLKQFDFEVYNQLEKELT